MLPKIELRQKVFVAASIGACLVLSGAAVALVSGFGPSKLLGGGEPAAPLPTPAPVTAAPVAPAPPTPVAFEAALLKAANDLLSKANLEGAPGKVRLVIDPLVDGVSGAQSATTRAMEQRIAGLVKSSYQRFEMTPFSTQAVADQPVVLVGTFTAINNAGLANGPRDAYRICLTLADLRTKKIISKGVARALPDGIDTKPTAFFEDSPVSLKDPAIDAYIKTCQGSKLGETIDQAYTDRVRVAALVSEAIRAYDAKNYTQSLANYEEAVRMPGGEQLRVYNGIYLANWKLNRREAAREAFGKIVDQGLKAERLAVKFLFSPNAAQFTTDRDTSRQFNVWVSEIAKATSKGGKCLEVVGHTSATGAAELNDQLSLKRADYVKGRLQEVATGAKVSDRFVAKGLGSREMIVGTGKDGSSDALDRRVEFKTMPCATPVAAEKTAEKPAEKATEKPARPAKATNSKPRRQPQRELTRAERAELERYVSSGDISRFLGE
jgi:outer membrane protein OmpA-like peptidoglycan-associated protein